MEPRTIWSGLTSSLVKTSDLMSVENLRPEGKVPIVTYVWQYKTKKFGVKPLNY